jgi:hypothetical protein
MKIKIFTVNPFQMNCYLYYDETGLEGIIIDPEHMRSTKRMKSGTL